MVCACAWASVSKLEPEPSFSGSSSGSSFLKILDFSASIPIRNVLLSKESEKQVEQIASCSKANK